MDHVLRTAELPLDFFACSPHAFFFIHNIFVLDQGRCCSLGLLRSFARFKKTSTPVGGTRFFCVVFVFTARIRLCRWHQPYFFLLLNNPGCEYSMTLNLPPLLLSIVPCQHPGFRNYRLFFFKNKLKKSLSLSLSLS